jgi:benzoate membrane transport protein
MRFSVVISAVVAIIVGFGGSVAIVIAAAEAVGADQSSTSSWIAALCLAMMITSIFLSFSQRIPIVTAWSTPGAALIATSQGFTLGQAGAAFALCGVLILLTAIIPFLERTIRNIPTPVAAGILAGVLFPFVVSVINLFESNLILTSVMVGTFLVLRPMSPAWAVIGVLASGLITAITMEPDLTLPGLEWALPKMISLEWRWGAALGLGMPLFVVTMASQNLPGLAVLQTAGYAPKTKPVFAATGLATLVNSIFGAHSIGLAAITASICVNPDAHPDKSKRWLTGISYGCGYGILAFCAPMLVAFFAILPSEFIVILAGLALVGPLTSALSSAVNDGANRLPGVVAFVVTASGAGFFQIGSAFWGLAASIAFIGITNAIQFLIRRSGAVVNQDTISS